MSENLNAGLVTLGTAYLDATFGCPVKQGTCASDWCHYGDPLKCEETGRDCWFKFFIEGQYNAGRDPFDNAALAKAIIGWLVENYDCPSAGRDGVPTYSYASCPGDAVACEGADGSAIEAIEAQCWRRHILEEFYPGWLHQAPVLSVKQPWAWLLAYGLKTVENRTWRTSYRGPIFIHAGLKEDLTAYEFPAIKADPSIAQHGPEERGGIVGVVTLADITATSDSPWWDGQGLAWEVKEAGRLPFVPCKGRLGLFKYKGIEA